MIGVGIMIDFEMKFFKESEFACKCGCGIGFDEMDRDLLYKLEKARALAGIPFTITSAIRCIPHNKKVGGVQNSAHTKGKAADILIESSHHAFKVLKAAIEAGFIRIGYNNEKRFFHLDTDDSLPREVFFDY